MSDYECVKEDAAINALLAVTAETPPPFSLRRRVIERAASERSPSTAHVSPTTPVAAYAARVDSLLMQLHELRDKGWNTDVLDGWTVRDFVLHLGAIDTLVLLELQGRVSPPPDIATLTAAQQERLMSASNQEVAKFWDGQAQLIVELANDPRRRDDDPFDYLGMPLTLGQVLVDRAFETWVHTQDIRRALNLSLEAPPDAELALLCDLGARLLPVLPRPENVRGSLRLILTGGGGGSWLLHFDDDTKIADEDVSSTLQLDSVEFCLMVADRLSPDAVARKISGDEILARHALAVAPMLARL